MTKNGFAGALIVFALAGCASHGFVPIGVQSSNVASTSVEVVDDAYVIVGQEPIYVKQNDDPNSINTIIWNLPPHGPWYFPGKNSENPGIVFVHGAPVQTNCDIQAEPSDPRIYVCTYKKIPPSGQKKYVYQITVMNGTKILRSDPTAMNN